MTSIPNNPPPPPQKGKGENEMERIIINGFMMQIWTGKVNTVFLPFVYIVGMKFRLKQYSNLV